MRPWERRGAGCGSHRCAPPFPGDLSALQCLGGAHLARTDPVRSHTVTSAAVSRGTVQDGRRPSTTHAARSWIGSQRPERLHHGGGALGARGLVGRQACFALGAPAVLGVSGLRGEACLADRASALRDRVLQTAHAGAPCALGVRSPAGRPICEMRCVLLPARCGGAACVCDIDRDRLGERTGCLVRGAVGRRVHATCSDRERSSGGTCLGGHEWRAGLRVARGCKRAYLPCRTLSLIYMPHGKMSRITVQSVKSSESSSSESISSLPPFPAAFFAQRFGFAWHLNVVFP